jgi:UDP-N-acetyl-D-mannosaminuronate dehydrogenase
MESNINTAIVGLTLAMAFAQETTVLGYDISDKHTSRLKNGEDSFLLYSEEEILSSNITFSNNKFELKKANVYISAVPTNVDKAHAPY